MRVVAGNGAGGAQGEAAGENREPPQGHAGGGIEQVVAPVEQRAQGLMARQGGARAAGEQLQPVVEPLSEAAQPEDVDACGGEFDGERHAVERAADIAHHGRIGVVELVFAEGGGGAFDEELHRGIVERLARAEPRTGRWEGERRETVQPLAGDAQRLAAGGEDAKPRGGAQQDGGEFRHRLHDMLAIVQHEQHAAVPQRRGEFDERRFGPDLEPEGGGDGAGHQPRLADRGDVHPPHSVLVARDLRLGDRQSDGSLSDAAGAHDGEAAMLGKQRRELGDLVGPADQARHGRGQVVAGRGEGGRRRRRAVGERHDGSDEAVAAAGDVDEVAVAAMAIAEHAAQRGDLDLQIAFLDDDVRPDALHQLVLGHELAMPLDQGDQDLERTAAEPERGVAFEQQSLLREEAKAPEGNGAPAPVGRLRGRGVIHFYLALTRFYLVHVTAPAGLLSSPRR